jgi:hypothetical protein
MKAYVAGPMSYHPQFNFPLFDWVTAELREAGHEIISPAELDSDEVRAHAMASTDGEPGAYQAANNKTWGDFLSRDVKIIADSGLDAIVLLPKWYESRGAKLEAFVGLQCGLEFYEWTDRLDPRFRLRGPIQNIYIKGAIV